MNIYLYTGIFLLIIAINKLKLKDIILLSCIALFFLDFSYFVYVGDLMNTGSTERFSSLIGDRSLEGDFITGLLLFICSCFLSHKYSCWKNIVLIFIIFLGINYLLIIKSRSGLFATIISLLIIIFFLLISKIKYQNQTVTSKNETIIFESKHKNILSGYYNKVAILMLIFVISIAISFYYPFRQQSDRPNIKDAMSSIIDKNFHSNKTRLIYWNASLNMFADNPVTGIGYGQWSGTFPKYNGELFNDENVDINSSVHSHNDYLEILAEFGFVGVLYSIFIFYGVYRLIIKSKIDLYFVPYLAIAIGLSITSFFNFTKDNLAAMSLFIIAQGVSYSFDNKINIRYIEILINNKKLINKFILIIGLCLISFGTFFMIEGFNNQKQYLEAMTFKAQGKYSEMLLRLDAVSNFFYPVDMSKIPVDYYRGVGYFELKQYDKALEKFQRARARMKYYPTIMNNEAAALYMAGDYGEAEKRYNEIRNIFPNYIEPRINLLAFYMNQKRYKEAKDLITEIESKSFDSRYVKNYSVFLEIKDYFKRNNIK